MRTNVRNGVSFGGSYLPKIIWILLKKNLSVYELRELLNDVLESEQMFSSVFISTINYCVYIQFCYSFRRKKKFQTNQQRTLPSYVCGSKFAKLQS